MAAQCQLLVEVPRMWDSLKRMFRRRSAQQQVVTGSPSYDEDDESSDDFSWMLPPTTLVDPAPWDRYWRDQISHEMAEFVHMFCDDGDLVDALGFQFVNDDRSRYREDDALAAFVNKTGNTSRSAIDSISF